MTIREREDKLRNDIRDARRKMLDDAINFWLDNQEHTDGYRAYMIERAVSEYMELVSELNGMGIKELRQVKKDLG